MAQIKAVITDFIGTLANAQNYSLEASRIKLHKAITDAGFKISLEKFLEAYDQAHEKYRTVRYQKLREVTNSIWISETLNSLGYRTTPVDSRIKTALNIFFKDYIDTFQLKPYAKKLLKKIAMNYKIGLVSNFTYAPVIYASIRNWE